MDALDWVDRDLLEAAFRLLVAMLAGMAIGLNRDLHNKPVGMRTLGLVSLGSALVLLASTRFGQLEFEQDAVSRVIQGILTGVGFIGAGVVLHDKTQMKIHGLTTAATVWVAAVLGVTAGMGAWLVTIIGSGLTLALLVFGGRLEARLERLIVGPRTNDREPQND
ncbi:MAG TPA: MgtC/SapB family protein [Microvirga sp.]|jgi:putative Mg2+ transporter-C (MgtC) family protein|nr:MgtC/SapB family protein [Microvirga sp.]